MDDFLDRVWELITVFLNSTVVFLDTLLSPLEVLGPGFVIFVLAFIIVMVTRFLGRFYQTGRYVHLKKEFQYWQGIRQEAMKHPDREKGKALAKNIDQAQLNKAYYDYFFEGLLKHFFTNVIPILLMAAYVTTVYTPETLLDRFGEKWVWSVSIGSSFQVNASCLLFYVISLIFSFILFAVLKKGYQKRYAKKTSA